MTAVVHVAAAREHFSWVLWYSSAAAMLAVDNQALLADTVEQDHQVSAGGPELLRQKIKIKH